MASYGLYLVSAPADEELTLANGYCMLVQANNAIRNHSVPLIETSSGFFGLEAVTTLFLNHHNDIILVKSFILQVESDSECHLWCLDPAKLQ